MADTTQTRALLKQQDGVMPYDSVCAENGLSLKGLNFWQHFVPCRLHVAPSVYVAKEDGIVLGLISLKSAGKSCACWKIEHLVVHPQHRGRGIAQELLRFVFALFGSQGVSHFIAEVSDQNSAALNLLGSCGFRRCAKVTHYKAGAASYKGPADNVESEKERGAPGSGEWKSEGAGRSQSDGAAKHDSSKEEFRLAVADDQQKLYQLFQDALPPDHRLIYELVPDDFTVRELPGDINETNFDKLIYYLVKRKSWFWVLPDPERNVLAAAVKVKAHKRENYHLEFAVHPGWTQCAAPLVRFTLSTMHRAGLKGMILAKAYDFQPAVVAALEEANLERIGFFSLLAREHWLRAKKPNRVRVENRAILSPLPKPVVNRSFINPNN